MVRKIIIEDAAAESEVGQVAAKHGEGITTTRCNRSDREIVSLLGIEGYLHLHSPVLQDNGH